MIKLRTLVAISLIAVAAFIGVSYLYESSEKSLKISSNTKKVISNALLIEKAAKDIKETPNQEKSYLRLLQLETELKNLPPEEAETIIANYLDTGDDVHTQLQFLLKTDGYLETAPTLRVFLLDQQGAIAPEAAAKYSKKVTGAKNAPDEWAIALRNYARELRHPPEKDTFLKTKLEALLTHTAWTEAPTLGYLQAYDLIVFCGGNAFVPELSKQIEDSANPAAQYAARLTLDRLAIRNYTATTQAMLSNMNALKNSPEVRGRIFARADVRDPKQRTLLERYLLKENLNATELDTFANSFPNINLEISHNLVTQEKKTPLSFHAEQDRASLAMIQELLANEDLSEAQSTALTTLQKRLRTINDSINCGKKQASHQNQPTSTP